jgi:hypothetical protein
MITAQQFHDLDARVMRVIRDRRREIPQPMLDLLEDLCLLTYAQGKPFLLLEPGTFVSFWTALTGRDRFAVFRAMTWLKERNIIIEEPRYRYWINPNFKEWGIKPREALRGDWSQYHVTLELPPDPLDLKVILRDIALNDAVTNLSAPDRQTAAAGNPERTSPGAEAPSIQDGAGDKQEEKSRLSQSGTFTRSAAAGSTGGGFLLPPADFVPAGAGSQTQSETPEVSPGFPSPAHVVKKTTSPSGSPGGDVVNLTTSPQNIGNSAPKQVVKKTTSPARARESFSDKALEEKQSKKSFSVQAPEGLAKKLPTLVRMAELFGDLWTVPNAKNQLDGEKWERRYAKNRVKVERVLAGIEEKLLRDAEGKSKRPLENIGSFSEHLWVQFTSKRYYEHLAG